MSKLTNLSPPVSRWVAFSSKRHQKPVFDRGFATDPTGGPYRRLPRPSSRPGKGWHLPPRAIPPSTPLASRSLRLRLSS